MRNFSLKKKGNFRRNSRKAPLVAVAAIIIGLAAVLVFRSLVGGALAGVTAPLYEVRQWLVEESGVVASYFQGRSTLVAEIDELRNENEQLKARETLQSVLRDENAELRGLLNVSTSEPRIAAGVLARPPFVPYDVLYIDRGTRDGILEGAAVYYTEDYVIGFVSRAFANSALVTLITTPSFETTVYIYGPNVFATARGEGDGVLRVRVPQGVPLSKGDMVVLPSLQRGVVGAVTAIQSTASEPEQSGFVLLRSPLQSMRTVGVGSVVQQSISFEEAMENINNTAATLFTLDIPEETLQNAATSSVDASSSSALIDEVSAHGNDN